MLTGRPEIPGDDDESKSLSKSMTSSFVILKNLKYSLFEDLVSDFNIFWKEFKINLHESTLLIEESGVKEAKWLLNVLVISKVSVTNSLLSMIESGHLLEDLSDLILIDAW